MTEYGLFLEDISGNIQFPMDVFSEVAQPKTRKVTIYHSSDSNDPKTLPEDIQPVLFGFRGLLQTDIVERERKLQYLLRTDNEIILVYFDRDIATYVSISKGAPTNDPAGSGFDIFSINCAAKGVILGQVREAVDTRCTNDGVEITDTDAMQDKAIRLDSSGNSVYFSQTQNEYMLPDGSYNMVARMKQSADASDNISKMEVDVSSNPSVTQTITEDYKIYELAFTVDASDNENAVQFKVSKEDVSGNVSVDFIGFCSI